jgi:zinc protease
MAQTSRKTAPEPLAPVPFNIPQPFQTTLANGLRVVIFEDRRLPLVSYRLAFMSGDAHDPKDAIGLTSAMASMLTEGTQNYSSLALAEKIERLGASISANASDDFTMVAASTLALYNSEILDLISEIVFRPTFPADELDLYKRNAIENLKFQRSQPNFLANEQTARLLYGDHPYSRVSPSSADIEKLSSEALSRFHNHRFIPNNAVLIVVGDVERDSVLAEIESHFGDWAQGTAPQSVFPQLPPRDKTQLTIVDRQGSAQANIVLANTALSRNDPDYFAVTVMNQVLGAGASSRVFMNLREEKGYTYGAYTRIDAKKLAGDFEATAEVRTAVTGDSLKEFFYELNRIRDEKVSDQELADAKNFLTGVFPIRAETQEGLTNLIVSQELYDLPADYLQTYRDEINAISVDDVQRVAKEYLMPDRMVIVIVGDAEQILPQAQPYSDSVEIFDTDGNRRDLSNYGQPESEPEDFGGSWKLTVDFQGQQVPVSLSLDQTGDSATGRLETILGSGDIKDGSVRGNRLSATANTEIQGQDVEFVINGQLVDGVISGTIAAAIIPDSLTFTGTRS